MKHSVNQSFLENRYDRIWDCGHIKYQLTM